MGAMKIIQVCSYYYPIVGGVEKVVQSWSEELVRRGHEVTVLCYPAYPNKGFDNGLLREERINGVEVKRLHVKEIATYLASCRFDVLHVHSFPSSHCVVSILIARLRHKPCFVSGHYAINDIKSFRGKNGILQTILYRFLLNQISLYFAIVPTEKKGIMWLFKLPETKIIILPNGYSQAEFSGITGVLKKDINKFSIIFIGRITPIKGVDILIEAFLQFSKAINRQSSLTICGPVEDASYYRLLKERTESHSNIIWVQWSRSELCEKLPSYDVLVLPSRGEVFGIVLIEAMAAGVIPVGANSGGIPEVINDGRTGFLFNTGSSKSLYEVLDKIASFSHDEREKFSRRIQKHALRYEWSNIIDNLEAIYRKQCS